MAYLSSILWIHLKQGSKAGHSLWGCRQLQGKKEIEGEQECRHRLKKMKGSRSLKQSTHLLCRLQASQWCSYQWISPDSRRYPFALTFLYFDWIDLQQKGKLDNFYGINKRFYWQYIVAIWIDFKRPGLGRCSISSRKRHTVCKFLKASINFRNL